MKPREDLMRRKGISDVSSMPFRRDEMVYAKRRWLQHAAQNRLPYSSYSSSGWSCDATDAGLISIGPNADLNIVSYDGNFTASENGIQTWTGTGTVRSTTASDLSSVSVITFSIEFGMYQRSVTPHFTLDLGICDATGATTQSFVLRATTGGGPIWFTTPVSAITATATNDVYFYLTVTPDTALGKWWTDRAHLEYEVTQPGNFIKTAGAAIVYTSDTQMRGVGKMHMSEVEFVQEESDGIVTPREGQDQSSYVIPVDDGGTG